MKKQKNQNKRWRVVTVMAGIVATFMLLSGMFSACKPELKIANINPGTNTFDLVDVKSGKKISYKKLMLNKDEVVDFHCSNSFDGTVTFALKKGDIVRSGNTVTTTGQAFTKYAELKYKLENGVLTIFHK